MNLATLRLTGNDSSLDEVVGKLQLAVSSRVKKGDPRRRGGVHASSALSASIADAHSPGEMLGKVREFLAACHAQGPKLFANGVEAELSIGITVGDSIQYVASVDLSSSEIRELAALGLSLNFTAYPTSDDVNDPSDVK